MASCILNNKFSRASKMLIRYHLQGAIWGCSVINSWSFIKNSYKMMKVFHGERIFVKIYSHNHFFININNNKNSSLVYIVKNNRDLSSIEFVTSLYSALGQVQ